MNIMAANRQWSSRPADQRFVSLTDLHARVSAVRAGSGAKVISSHGITCAPSTGDTEGLVAIGPGGNAVNVTHWSFGQLAAKADAPAGYLRTLPGAMAADCINYGLRVKNGPEDMGILLYRNGGEPELRAVTGPNYGRIWNQTVTGALVDRFGDGLTGDFRVPGEFGKAVEITKENTTLYASDRDMWVFLADEQHRITVPNRRDGQAGDMARGFFVWNSEVGSATFGIATFLFDYVCCNRIVWGAQDYQEIRIRHTASAPDKWLEQARPAIEAYANSSTASVTDAIAKAKAGKLGDENRVKEFLAKRFTKSEVAAIAAAHMSDEQRPIETLWDATVAVTAYARGIQYQDARVRLEREAGKIMDLAK